MPSVTSVEPGGSKARLLTGLIASFPSLSRWFNRPALTDFEPFEALCYGPKRCIVHSLFLSRPPVLEPRPRGGARCSALLSVLRVWLSWSPQDSAVRSEAVFLI